MCFCAAARRERRRDAEVVAIPTALRSTQVLGTRSYNDSEQHKTAWHRERETGEQKRNARDKQEKEKTQKNEFCVWSLLGS